MVQIKRANKNENKIQIKWTGENEKVAGIVNFTTDRGQDVTLTYREIKALYEASKDAKHKAFEKSVQEMRAWLEAHKNDPLEYRTRNDQRKAEERMAKFMRVLDDKAAHMGQKLVGAHRKEMYDKVLKIYKEQGYNAAYDFALYDRFTKSDFVAES